MDCVSLFSGAGGLDLGFRAAGFKALATVEIDPDACRTLKANGFKHVACDDVSAWLNQNSQLRPDVLIGGPPCQPFSKSAYWNNSSAKGLADERAGCLATFLAAVEALQPTCFLIENVPGFVTAGGVGQLQAALARLRKQDLDYHFNWCVLNCADYGVPQKRERFFGIGSLLGPPRFRTPPTRQASRQLLGTPSGDLGAPRLRTCGLRASGLTYFQAYPRAAIICGTPHAEADRSCLVGELDTGHFCRN